MKRITSILALSIVTASMLSVGTMSAQNVEHQVRVGVAAGANYNFLQADAQEFIGNSGDAMFASTDYSNMEGPGIYAGIVVEYDFSNVVGVHVRGMFDERCVSKSEGSSELTTHLIYASFEPAVRLTLSSPLRLHMLAGPSISFPVQAAFDYSTSRSEAPVDAESVEMNNVNDVAVGGWVGFGMDIALGNAASAWYVTPFVEGSYIHDQKEADVKPAGFDTVWSTVSARAGIQVKLGL